jgi:hypothetical protein
MPETKFILHKSCGGVVSKKDFSCKTCGKITDVGERKLVQPAKPKYTNRSKYPKNKHGINILNNETTTQKSDMNKKFEGKNPRKIFARVNQ